MEVRTLKFIADACQGELLVGSPESVVSRICTDSRQVQAGDLFFALAGEKFDAHDYLVEVARKGAAALVIARGKAELATGLFRSVAAIAVDDTRVALGRLAA